MSRRAWWLCADYARKLLLAVIVPVIVTVPAIARAGHWADGFSPPGTDGSVDAFLEFEGGVFIGGAFTFVGSLEAAHVAIWDPALEPASRWCAAGAGLDGRVRGFAEHQGKLCVCGDFHHSGEIAVNSVARWDGFAWRPVGDGLNVLAYSLASYAGDLYAACGPLGWAARSVSRWDGVTWQELFTTDGYVYGMLAHGEELIIYGDFSAIDGASYNSIVTWDGSALGRGYEVPEVGWPSSWLEDLAVYEGQLVAAGMLPLGNPAVEVYIARWNGSAWEPMDSPPEWYRRNFIDLVSDGDVLFASGLQGIGWEGPSECWLDRWDGAGWEPYVRAMRNADIEEIYLGASGLWIGGSFTSMPFESQLGTHGPTASANVALVQTDGACHLFPDALGTDHAVRDMLVHDDQLIVTGSFMAAGGHYSPKAAAWDGQSWSSFSSSQLIESGLDHLAGMSRVCAWRDTLVAAGEFTVSYWDPDFYEAIRTPAGWSAWNSGWIADYESWNDRLILASAYNLDRDSFIYSRRSAFGGEVQLGALDGYVLDLAEWQGSLVALGRFTSINGVSLFNLARYNGTSWSGIGGGVGNSVEAACTYGSDLVIGGSFTTAGGVPAARIARWDGTAWWPLGQGINGTVHVLLADGPYLIAGGSFTQAGGLPTANIAVWFGERWRPLGLGTNGQVNALELYQGDLYVGGEFTRAGGHIAGGFARWEGDLVTGVGEGGPPPLSTAITSVAPNPFNPLVEICFTLNSSGTTEMAVYDLRGRRVRTLRHEELAAGQHTATWDGTDSRGAAVAAGVYLVRLTNEQEDCARKAVLAR